MPNQSLQWNIRDDTVIHADPAGLIKSYYIYPPQSEHNDSKDFVLELIENSGYWDKADTTTHDSLEEAKKTAQFHYEKVVAEHTSH